MSGREIIEAIRLEYDFARRKHPDWPVHILEAVSILNEEAGELTRAANNFYWEDGTLEDVKTEAIQTAAMAIRFLSALYTYERHQDDTGWKSQRKN